MKRICKVWVMERNGSFDGPSSFKNFEMQKNYQNEPRFNGAFSRNNPP